MEKLVKFCYLLVLLFINFTKSEEECPGTVSKPQNRLFDQDFGMPLTADDFLAPMITPWIFRDYIRPWRHLAALSKDWGSTIKTDKDNFQINLDVQHFAPEEITVKTADGYVIVEGKHEEKEDEHGMISRQFVRKYSLPAGTEPETVVSQLSSDGILTVTAPRKEVSEKGERVVPISQTGPVRKGAKEKEDSQGSCQQPVKN